MDAFHTDDELFLVIHCRDFQFGLIMGDFFFQDNSSIEKCYPELQCVLSPSSLHEPSREFNTALSALEQSGFFFPTPPVRLLFSVSCDHPLASGSLGTIFSLEDPKIWQEH